MAVNVPLNGAGPFTLISQVTDLSECQLPWSVSEHSNP